MPPPLLLVFGEEKHYGTRLDPIDRALDDRGVDPIRDVIGRIQKGIDATPPRLALSLWGNRGKPGTATNGGSLRGR
jgi:hypothetical protein